MRLLPVCPLAVSVCLLSWFSVAQGAEPTVDECLQASDASNTLDSEHKLRAERAQLLICASSSCPKEIRNECTQRVDDVNRSIPNIIFEVKDNAGHDVTSVRVQMDSELLAERLDGTALAVDPGEHSFVFEIAGQARALTTGPWPKRRTGEGLLVTQ